MAKSVEKIVGFNDFRGGTLYGRDDLELETRTLPIELIFPCVVVRNESGVWLEIPGRSLRRKVQPDDDVELFCWLKTPLMGGRKKRFFKKSPNSPRNRTRPSGGHAVSSVAAVF